MRARNTAQDLQVFAVAGTHTAVLSFDFNAKPQNLLGLAIERRDLTTGRIIWLEGQKCFRSIVPKPVRGQRYPTQLHPIQSFMWKDFTLVPGRSYTFKITPVKGRPSQLKYGTPVEISVTAEQEWNGQQGVYFNRGVSGSQSYSNHFPEGKISKMDAATRERAFEWLSRGLFEGLKGFIERTKKDEFLYGAFYEFHEPRTLALLKAARDRSVTVELVVDGKQYGDSNKAAVRKAGIAQLVKMWRTKAKIPHNKFLIRCSKSGTPVELWTGSTNISEKGIFGQCNTGHALKDRETAGRYLDFWKKLKTDPERASLTTEVMRLQADVSADNLADGSITPFFSPRSSLTMLDTYADLVHDAREMACGMFPFNVDQRFRDAFNTPKDFPRYVIVDKSSNHFAPNDSDLDVTAGAYLKNPIDQWLKEKSAGTLFYGGVDFIHNKLLIVDPLGRSPKIVVGSANLSKPSTNQNDENMLVLKGPAYLREADIYLTEFIRLFDHFDFREWLNTAPTKFKPFLEEGPRPDGRSWVDKYFDGVESLSYKRKMVFKNMHVPAR
ncbi:MAG: phospholipase D-like domain-containing protein [Planctomycetota bacterium]